MKKKSIIYVAIAIVVIGIALIAIKGLNFDLAFSNSKRLDIYVGKKIDLNEINQIAKDTLGDNKIIIREIETFGDMFSITANDFSDEQIEQMVSKINEKYDVEITKDEHTSIIEIPNLRERDIVKPYIIPTIISLAIISLYMLVRFRKNGGLKIVVITILGTVLVELLLLSVYAICRLPINNYTMSIALIVLVLTLFGYNCKFENALNLEKLKRKHNA